MSEILRVSGIINSPFSTSVVTLAEFALDTLLLFVESFFFIVSLIALNRFNRVHAIREMIKFVK